MGGSITTNGTLGGLDYDDILGWEIRFTSPAGPTVLNSEEHYFQMIYLRAMTGACDAWNTVPGYTSFPSDEVCDGPIEPMIATLHDLRFNDIHNQLTDLAFSDVDPALGAPPSKAFRGVFTGDRGIRFVGVTSAVLIVDNTIDPINQVGPAFNNYPGESPNWSSLQIVTAGTAFASIPVPEPTTLMLAASLFMLVLRLPRTFGR